MTQEFFCIRHVATGELMPQAKARRGYSHWNPSNPDHSFKRAINVPRLLASRTSAKKAIAMWATLPNAYEKGYQTYEGEWDIDLHYKADDRKKEDLEIVSVTLEIP